MEERKCPETEYQPSDISDIGDLLKYPADYSPREKEIEDTVEEGRIHPEFTKRDKQLVPVISDENGVSESDEDSSEFEEEIVVVEVQRKSSWNKKRESPRQFEVPEWIEERKSSETERQAIDGLLNTQPIIHPEKGRSKTTTPSRLGSTQYLPSGTNRFFLFFWMKMTSTTPRRRV